MSTFKNLVPTASFDTSVLKGSSVVITGGASGLGKAFAQDFIKAGAFVTIGDINDANGEKVASELGSNAQFVHCDITNWSDQLKLFKAAIAKSPNHSCDVVCANAGIGGADDVYNLEDTDDPKEPNLNIIKVHTIGTLYTTKMAMHYFHRQSQSSERDRCLIITASLAGYIGHVANPQYCMAKWGVRSLMRTFRETCGKDGIRVNLIAPSYIATAILPQEYVDAIRSKGYELALVEDAAKAVLHLASDKTINGRGIAVVPRSMVEHGYFDLQDDPPTEFLDQVQAMVRDFEGPEGQVGDKTTATTTTTATPLTAS